MPRIFDNIDHLLSAPCKMRTIIVYFEFSDSSSNYVFYGDPGTVVAVAHP